jgi:FkbM family methyltransferase
MLKQRLAQIRKALLLVRDPVFRKGLLHGIGASIEHRDLLSHLSPATIVDIGANVGQFSLLARRLFPKARIFAFEPLARPAAKYRTLLGQDPQIRFFQSAIGPAVETRQMHVSARDDSSSLLPISAGQTEFAPGTGEVGREEVAVSRLEALIAGGEITAPALIKLDVQGFELEALKGCESLLPRFDHVYAELSFFRLYEGQVLAHELIAWLAARNFQVCCAANPSYGRDNRIVQLDFLFERTDARN